jgi:hypothetical protein
VTYFIRKVRGRTLSSSFDVPPKHADVDQVLTRLPKLHMKSLSSIFSDSILTSMRRFMGRSTYTGARVDLQMGSS